MAKRVTAPLAQDVRGRECCTREEMWKFAAHLMWLQVDDVRETWFLVEVEHNTNLVQVRGNL